MATVLYNDRVYAYREMVKIDAELDDAPTPKKVEQLAELRIRNFQAFDELKSYNQTGIFLFKHPLVVHHSFSSELEQMLRRDPILFLENYTKCVGNIKRYSSFINSSKKSDTEKQNARENRNRHQEQQAIYHTVLEQNLIIS